jgi:hypothetical protein
MLLEQFGGANGELAAAMQHTIQGWNCVDELGRRDLLLDMGNCTIKEEKKGEWSNFLNEEIPKLEKMELNLMQSGSPPFSRAADLNSNGYDPYDYFELGDYDRFDDWSPYMRFCYFFTELMRYLVDKHNLALSCAGFVCKTRFTHASL